MKKIKYIIVTLILVVIILTFIIQRKSYGTEDFPELNVLMDEKNSNNIHGSILIKNENIENVFSIINNKEDSINDDQKIISKSYAALKLDADKWIAKDNYGNYRYGVIEFPKPEEGFHILEQAKNAKIRIEKLSFMYKVCRNNGENEKANQYAERAIVEIENACKLEYWSVNHFLGIAEMAYGIAIGYDWLYDYLTDSQRDFIEKSLMEKAIIPSITNYSDAFNDDKNPNNWVLVCHGGIGTAALALFDTSNERLNKYKIDVSLINDIGKNETYLYGVKEILKTYYEKQGKDLDKYSQISANELCAAIIVRSIKKIPEVFNVMNGMYDEGTTYYYYGINFASYFIASLENRVGTDFGLSKNESISTNLLYILNMKGQAQYENKKLVRNGNETIVKTWMSSKLFCYGDSDGKFESGFGLLWLAKRIAENGNGEMYAKALTWLYTTNNYEFDIDTMLAYDVNFDMRYKNDGSFAEVKESELLSLGLEMEKCYYNDGSGAIFRGSFTDTNSIYLGIKGGSNESHHNDLDIGTFIFEALGTRWSDDPGAASYNYALGYFDKFNRRYNNYYKRAESHSTLVINPVYEITGSGNESYAKADQNIYSNSEITEYSDAENNMYAILDMTNAYNSNNNNNKQDYWKNANNVRRGIKLIDNKTRFIMQDEIELNNNSVNQNVYWFMNVDNNDNKIADGSDMINPLEYHACKQTSELKQGEWTIILSRNNKVAVITKYLQTGPVSLKLESCEDGEFEVVDDTTLNPNLLPNAQGLTAEQKEYFKINQNDKKKKLMIHLTDLEIGNDNRATISVVFTPIYKTSDYSKLTPTVYPLNEWNEDKYAPNLSVKYSNTETTNQDVTVTITADEKIQSIDGWTISDDNMSISKKYGKNTTEDILVYDKAGNSTKATINISNIENLKVEIQNCENTENNGNNYIKNIQPNMKIADFTKLIKTNGKICFTANDKEVNDGNLKIFTGMKIKVSLDIQNLEYYSIVKGDTNGDGQANINDIFEINKYRLKKVKFDYIKSMAGDLNNDGIIDIKDIFKLNKYRLGKINSL